MEKQRAIVFLVLIVLGAGLLACGLHARIVLASSGGQDQVATASEMDITREVARGGVKRNESGEIAKTYQEGEEAPAACPT